MSSIIYLIGFAILVAGLVWGASILGVPSTYIAIGAVILAGLGIMSAVRAGRGDTATTAGKTDVTIVK